MNNLTRQPIVHFIFAGALIFLAYSVTEQPVEESAPLDKVIEVDRAAILNFMQYRAQAFDPQLFGERLDAMSEEARQNLINDFVREEALHREALTMGMDQGDYIIRQRLVQKVEFLLENLVTQSLEADDDDIREFYESRKQDYQVDAVYTFTHIFFDSGERGWEQAEQDAAALLGSAAMESVAFNDASQYGDRYPFMQNYVERTRDFVVNNFTEEFVAALDELTPGDGNWHGPFASRYGMHLVLLRERSEPVVPELNKIRERVVDDWRYEKVLENRKAAEEQVVSGYEVSVDL